MCAATGIGLVGCGLIARRAHLPAFAADPHARLVAVASGHVGTAQAAAAQFSVLRVYAHWQELVADPEIDAVSICTPNALHAQIAIAAARAGKHVLVEKPMAVSLAEADAMIEAARAAGTVLMVAHNLRFQPLFAAARRELAADAIGRIFSARGVFGHAGPDGARGATSDWFWREDAAGGGALLDLGIHMVDILRWFVGEPVVDVMAMTARVQKPTFADDNALVLLCFAGGALATMQASWTARPGVDRLVTVQGERGRLVLDPAAAQPLLLLYSDGAGQRSAAAPPSDSADSLYAHFVRAVREGVHPISDGAEARASLAVVLAAYDSARGGKAVRPG
ncbi:MAG TPA: Gfo/Idh/MocA family oxidoreductase [Dehalococcoidia bacterium]|nr:Gfo/Idh/MocA family oxidoreductase [Dehalococcoidia bacterium]